MNMKHWNLLASLALLLAACAPATQPPTATPSPLPPTATIPPTVTAAPPTPTPLAPTIAPVENGPLTRARFFSAVDGWGLTEKGDVVRTTSGPDGFIPVTPEKAFRGMESDLTVTFFLDIDHAWVIYPDGALSSQFPPPARVWRTSDGGQTWKADLLTLSEEEPISPTALTFVDETHGWLLGQIYPGMHHVYALLFATQDGGQTWEKVSDSTQSDPIALPGSYSLPYGPDRLTFVDANTGFSGGTSLLRTEDGGRAWVPVDLPPAPDLPEVEQPAHIISPPVFASAQDGILIDSLYAYADTNCPPCDLSYQMPAATTLYVTHDGGQSWTPAPAPEKSGLVGLVDATHAWFIGRSDAEAANGSIYFSDDAGQTWTAQAAGSPVPLCARLVNVDSAHWLAYNPYSAGQFPVQGEAISAACRSPFEYRSNDGGATWAPVP